MKTFSFLIPCFFLLSPMLFAQSYVITQPVISFDNNTVSISYDILSKNKSDHFYIWVEIKKQNGESLPAKSFSGDIGKEIPAGTARRILWIPEKDSVYLDEDVTVEIKAEKYIRTFNKGSAILMSAALPGLGQTKINNGKPYWLAGVAAYGAIAGGIIAYNSSMSTYDLYKAEEDISKREALYDKAQKQMGTSQALIISGAVVWAANIIWVALIPVRYKPLKYVNLSFNPSSDTKNGTLQLTCRLNF